MSEKLALVGMGGTIAMVPNAEGALAPARNAEELVEHAPGLEQLGVDLDVISLVNKDSTNINPDDWGLIIAKITELQPDYDGVLVAHGTDTMPYTATAASMALGKDLTIPVIFTGSQLPLNEVGTDGRVNLERSAKVALEAARDGISETMIVFSDRVLRASRTIKTSEARFDAFDSPGFPHLATITATDTVFGPHVQRQANLGFAPRPRDNFETGVASIDVKPGLRPDLVRAVALSGECTGLILKSLGAGNVPSEGEYSLIPVIEETVKAGKPVIIATKFLGGKTLPQIYETGRLAIEAGAGHASNMTDVATEVKLAWLMGQDIREPEAVNVAMLEPVVGEND